MRRFLLSIFSLLLGLVLQAQPFLNLPSLLSDNMVLQADSNVTLWGWADPGVTVRISTSWGEKIDVKTDYSTRFTARLKTPAATFDPQSLTFSITRGGRTVTRTVKNVLIGQVWLCTGQSNMNFAAANGVKDMREEIESGRLNGKIRLFTAPKHASECPQEDVFGSWSVCDPQSAEWFSAVGYFFGDRLQKALDQPVGLVNASWGGTPVEVWTRPEVLNDQAKKSWEAHPSSNRAGWSIGSAYNGMIAPLTNMTVAGAIWYQGESNRSNASLYGYEFSTMIQDWRRQFRQNLPFYFVQIAPKHYDDNDLKGALVREQQDYVSKKVPGTGMVAVYDLVDDINDIHPKFKKEVGGRLACQALTDVYGVETGVCRHPSFASMTVSHNRCKVKFDNAAGGLECRGTEIVGLEVGDGRDFFPAKGIVQGETLVAWSDKVRKPVSVRYCFGEAIGNLYGKSGLPVLPFRTDSEEPVIVVESAPVTLKTASVRVSTPDSQVRTLTTGTVYFTNRPYKVSMLSLELDGLSMLCVAGGQPEPVPVKVTALEDGMVYVLARNNRNVLPSLDGWKMDTGITAVYQTHDPAKPGMLVVYGRKFRKGETVSIEVKDFAGVSVVSSTLKQE